MMVYRRPGQGISHFGELCSHRSPNSDESASTRMVLGCCDSHAYQVCTECGRSIGMCGYTSLPEDGCTCLFYPVRYWFRTASVMGSSPVMSQERMSSDGDLQFSAGG